MGSIIKNKIINSVYTSINSKFRRYASKIEWVGLPTNKYERYAK